MMKRIKLFEMFAGYGGASFALKKADLPFECVGFSEIDYHAINAYTQNHTHTYFNRTMAGTWTFPHNYGDCRTIQPEMLPDFDLLTAGFPCQPFSIAGQNKGRNDERGLLFDDIIRIAKVKQPRFMLLENVKGLTYKKHEAFFDYIIKNLKDIGYHIHYKVFNSKDFGIPQNRERIWFFCFRDEKEYDDFYYPQEQKLLVELRDIIEPNPDSIYDLSKEQIDRIKEKLILKKICKPCMLHNIYGGFKEKGIRVFQDYSPTLRTPAGGGHLPVIMNTITEAFGRGGSSKEFLRMLIKINKYTYKLRKITPTECFRLMGFLNDEIKLKGLSDTQKFKLAGNGWDINLASILLTSLLRGFYGKE